MLVKLAFVMQRLKKYLKKIFVMIDKDGGGDNFWILWGGHSCYEEGHRAHGVPPTGENPALVHLYTFRLLMGISTSTHMQQLVCTT